MHVLTKTAINFSQEESNGMLSHKDLMAVEILYNQAIIDNNIVKSK